MFPLRDDNPTFHQSFATFLIIALNVLSWIFLQGAGFGAPFMESLSEYGFIPRNGDWAAMATSMFMHGGWFHLISNMWFLSVFGDNVEEAMGSVRFVLFYLLCGLSAAIAQMISGPSSALPMVGASGAIGGVMGAYAVLYPRAPVHVLIFLGIIFYRIVVPAVIMLGYWFFLQILSGATSLGGAATGGVAVWAHIGGFLAGVILVKVFCRVDRLAGCRSRKGRTERLVRRILN